ncbi:MAG: exodeoxyribonuclease V subunit gamma, partial [Variovorax sp.]
DGLEEYGLLDEVLDELRDIHQGPSGAVASLPRRVGERIARIRRSGRLPMAGLGQRSERALVDTLVPMLERWSTLYAQYPEPAQKEPLRFDHEGLVLDDWLDGLRLDSPESGQPVWLELLPTRLCEKGKPLVIPQKLISAWVRTLVASACGAPVQGMMVGRDATVTVEAMPADQARASLRILLDAWREGMGAPLPLASKTALAWLAGANAEQVYEGGMFVSVEVSEACLSRMFPDYEALTADGRFETLAESLFGPLASWARTHVAARLHSAPGAFESEPA